MSVSGIPSGAWHQFGFNSQKLVREQLRHGNGVGCIISPRYLNRQLAVKYSDQYRELGSAIAWDPEFYTTTKSVTKGDDYPTEPFRESAEAIAQWSQKRISDLASALREINQELGTSALISPAIAYQAKGKHIVEANRRLFRSAREAAKHLEIPVLASVPLSRSVTSSSESISEVLSEVTRFRPDGWYFGFAFPAERVPSDNDYIQRFAGACLTLAATGKALIHQSAGPLTLLSFGFGATATGIGFWQNLWQFDPARYRPSSGQGGGGDAPPRFFSDALWGTIIVPDEVARLPDAIQEEILTETPFSESLREAPRVEIADWERWDANKHLTFVLGQSGQSLAHYKNPLLALKAAKKQLQDAIEVHRKIGESGVRLKTESKAKYLPNWLKAVNAVEEKWGEDYEYLALLKGGS